jgi:hypothetical protein
VCIIPTNDDRDKRCDKAYRCCFDTKEAFDGEGGSGDFNTLVDKLGTNQAAFLKFVEQRKADRLQLKQSTAAKLEAPYKGAKSLCAKYPSDTLTAKAKAVTTTLSFRGFYLGMPMDEATAMLNHHHGEPTTNFWFGLVETNIHPMKLEKKWSNDLLPQLKTEPACAAGTADGKLTELTLDSGMLKKVFCLKDVNPSEFVARFAKEYNTSQPKYTPGKSGGAFIGSTGKVSSSDHWIITDEKTYEIMFTHRTGVESYMGLTGKVNEFSMTLQRPQGKFKD